MTSATSRRWYLATAAVLAVMMSAHTVRCILHGVFPGKEVLQLYSVFMGIVVVSWLVTDPRIPVTQRPSFDHGMLIWATFPLFAAYQMYSAHRWKGILIVLGLFGLFAAPSIALVVAFLVANVVA